jgi:HEAT repeat protein
VFRTTALAVVGAVLGTAGSSWGHSEPPPGPPPPPRAAKKIEHVKPLRWSWLHWWEANRWTYVAPLVQAHRTQETDEDDGAARQAAIAALINGLRDPEPLVRAACALSLGRMREEAGLDALELVADQDASDSVKAYALLAIAMIGNKDAQQFLMQRDAAGALQHTATAFGFGTTEYPLLSVVKTLEQLTARGDRASLWALRQHADRRAWSAAKQAVLGNASPWIVADALLGLGAAEERADHEILAEVLVVTDRARSIPAWQLLEEVREEKARAIKAAQTEGGPPLELVRERWNEAHRRLFDRFPVELPLFDHRLYSSGDGGMVGGIENIYMARLRASAAIALGDVEDEIAVQALLQVYNEPLDDYNIVPKTFAAISLGRIGATDALDSLMQVANSDLARQRRQSHYVESPLRGFSAIALGLYARPLETEQGLVDPARYEEAIALLLDRVADPRETPEVRSACAVALGLTTRTAVLKQLVTIAGQLTPDDRPLVGYVLLARAMLGDTNVVEPVTRLLSLPAHPDETTNLLTRRAGVLALGVVGKREVVPLLVQAWHETYYINREVVVALAFCGADGVSGEIVPRLEQSENYFERSYMANVLGLLYSDWPPPTARFLTGENFEMRHGLLHPFRSMSNEFLMQYLIYQFEERWY